MSSVSDEAFAERLADASGAPVERAALPGCPGGAALVAPEHEEGLAAVLRLCAAEGRRVVPCGLASKLSWAPLAPDPRPAVALSTHRFAGIVAHEPADGTLTAAAGTTIATLSAAAADGGGAVTPLLAEPSGATLGGVLASGQDGLDRLRHGAPRDHVLGVRLMLADGTTAKSGGRLVKNVTGYDLHRLVCGSRGTLAVILEATLRLFPAPRATARVEATFDDLGAASAFALEHARGADLPRRVVARPDGGRWTLTVDLAAGEAEVREQRAHLLAALARGSTASDSRPGRAAEHGREQRGPQHRDLEHRDPQHHATEVGVAELTPLDRAPVGPTHLVLTSRPSRLVATVAALTAAAEGAGAAIVPSSVEPCLGRARFELDSSAGSATSTPERRAAFESAVAAVRANLPPGAILLRRGIADSAPPGEGRRPGPAASDPAVDAAAIVAERVRRSLDPERLLAARLDA